jgi:biotin carboxyl carrier protein
VAAVPAGAVPSPLAGKVVSVDVKIGQVVAEGVQLLTLEAMKMNTFVYAPKGGTVAAVHVNPGDAVEEGAALLTLS